MSSKTYLYFGSASPKGLVSNGGDSQVVQRSYETLGVSRAPGTFKSGARPLGCERQAWKLGGL
jgi:hypothetical protein